MLSFLFQFLLQFRIILAHVEDPQSGANAIIYDPIIGDQYHPTWSAIMPEQHCMRITTVAWVFIEIRVVPVRRTMNSMIGRLTSGAVRAAMRERKNVNAHADVSRDWKVNSQRTSFSLTQQESFPPSSQPAHICFAPTLIDLP